MVYRKQANDQARLILKQSFSTSYMGRSSRNSLTLSWDLVMSTMQCCGVNNYTDFRDATQFVSAARMEGLGRKVGSMCVFVCVLLYHTCLRYLMYVVYYKKRRQHLQIITVLCLLPPVTHILIR